MNEEMKSMVELTIDRYTKQMKNDKNGIRHRKMCLAILTINEIAPMYSIRNNRNKNIDTLKYYNDRFANMFDFKYKDMSIAITFRNYEMYSDKKTVLHIDGYKVKDLAEVDYFADSKNIDVRLELEDLKSSIKNIFSYFYDKFLEKKAIEKMENENHEKLVLSFNELVGK